MDTWACKTVSGACTVMRMGWDQVRGVMERAVERGLARRADDEVIYIGVDEKALLKQHKYVTLVYDLQRKLVLDVMPERTEESLLSFYRSWKTTRLEKIRMVTMDMWGPYKTATMKMVPSAWLKIVHDRFHVAQHMGKAVDRVRIDEHRALMEVDDDTLKGTKHWWLYGQGCGNGACALQWRQCIYTQHFFAQCRWCQRCFLSKGHGPV